MLNLLKIITAILRASPALKGLVLLAVKAIDKENEKDALERKVAKDKNVDEAIDGVKVKDNENPNDNSN